MCDKIRAKKKTCILACPLGKQLSHFACPGPLLAGLRQLKRFSYDLEMKTREQNRNNKRTEIERFDWFVERIQTRVAFGWLSERSAKKTSCPKNFLEINRYFALTSYYNTIGQSNNVFSILGFSLAGKRRVHVLNFSSIG